MADLRRGFWLAKAPFFIAITGMQTVKEKLGWMWKAL
jgi:hypothetical protein